MRVKNATAALLATLGVLSAPLAFADALVVGKVEYIRVHDGDVITGWGTPAFWFTLTGVYEASCPSWAGRTPFFAHSKEQLSLVLSAQLMDREIAVFYKDQNLVNGTCRAAYMTTGNPPPAF